MADPITATIQTVQLGISAVRAGAAIAGLWESRRAAKASGPPQEEQGERRRGASIEEILLVLSTLGQRLLLLDVVDFDVLPQAYKAVRTAMEAADPEDDDVGVVVDNLDPVLQHLIAAAMVFCAACHPMPVWHGFGCGVFDHGSWAKPDDGNLWQAEIDRAIAILKSVPQGWTLLKKSPSRVARENPDYDENNLKSWKEAVNMSKDLVKQFEKNGLPNPLPPNDSITIRSWWFAGGIYGGAIYTPLAHDYVPLLKWQMDTGRFLYAWTIGEHANLKPWEAIVIEQEHVRALAEWLEGLNGMTFKVLRDTDLDWSKIKYKSSVKKAYKAQSGNEHGITGDPFMLVRNPDPKACIAKRMDELHFISVPRTDVMPTSPIITKDAGATVTVTPLTPTSPLTPTTDTPPKPMSPIIVPVVRKPIPVAASKPADPPSPPPSLSPPASPVTPLFPPPTPAAAQPLPPGWEQRTLPNGQVYYIDHITHTTTWTRPDASVLPSPPPSYEDSSLKPHLPPGWEARLDGNQIYYVDHNTQTCSWVRPKA